jgi:glycosyltransferase involved in cell wall biosynthesis
MKINIIANFQKNTGLMQDAAILRGILTATFGENIKIFRVPHVFPQCEECDYNFFLEVINPSLFSYARKNIWIPNPEWTYKNWIPYLHMVDEIWVKTTEARRIFNEAVNYKKPVKLIGWTSIDKTYDSTKDKKNYSKAIIPVGKNIYRNPKPIFQAYMRIKETDFDIYSKLPKLYVVHSPNHITITVPENIREKVILKSEVLKESDYDELLKECGLCICTSLSEGFGHAVNEAMSAGCNLILSSIAPFKEDLVGELQTGTWFGKILETVPQPDCLGVLVDTNVSSIVEALKEYTSSSFHLKKEGSLVSRMIYEHRHDEWVNAMKEFLQKNMPVPENTYSLKDVFPKEEDLPDVSILCITKDRRIFMPVLKYSYMIQSYPEDKMELVIIDDGDDPIEDTLIGVPNVKYVRCEQGMTISQKRNLAVKNAMYDILVNMDDDDVYPNNSVLHRVAMLLKEPAKECGFCTTIPCYDITKFSSFMNVPPMTLAMSERVSEATLIFTRKFWEESSFDDSIHIGEGNAFIRGREQMCRELSPQDVIVSLVHPKNTSSRKLPDIPESNGCHWGFNENLFTMVSQIGKALNTSVQKESGGDGESS